MQEEKRLLFFSFYCDAFTHIIIYHIIIDWKGRLLTSSSIFFTSLLIFFVLRSFAVYHISPQRNTRHLICLSEPFSVPFYYSSFAKILRIGKMWHYVRRILYQYDVQVFPLIFLSSTSMSLHRCFWSTHHFISFPSSFWCINRKARYLSNSISVNQIN